jgi:hypothetical protein
MKRGQESAVIACSLEKSDLAERRERWRRLADRAGLQVLMTEAGLRLLFRNAPDVEGELDQLAELERDCCAFADWSVDTLPQEVVLDVTAASEEGITAVQAMFNDLRVASAPTNS